jgi:hypothetical protein
MSTQPDNLILNTSQPDCLPGVKLTRVEAPPPARVSSPRGAILDYSLKTSEAVTLEILDGTGKIVRTYSGTDKAPAIPAGLNVKLDWFLHATVKKNRRTRAWVRRLRRVSQ